MRRLIRWLGSLALAVPLLIAIAVVLAWGTIYEARFGTAAVQRFVYHAWWFQALLGFLAVNLALAALERYPWQRRQVPFLLAHLGIILILLGGILGSRFGVDGQLVIPEGQAERMLELSSSVLVVEQPNPGVSAALPTQFETQAWLHELHWIAPVTLGARTIQLTVDRYYPDALMDERITDGGPTDNPAVQVLVADGDQQETAWLFAGDPERMGLRWGEAHVLFLDAQTNDQFARLLARASPSVPRRGVVSLRLPGMRAPRDIPVPETLGQELAIAGTPYRLAFKDYFPDFAITDQGPVSRSQQPNNPAIAFTLTGPEGTDAYLLFALHPEFSSMHQLAPHRIAAEARYNHAANPSMPPNGIVIIRNPSAALAAVLTGPGEQRQVIAPLEPGHSYVHPTLGYHVTLQAYYPRAMRELQPRNRSNEIKAEAVHLIGREGAQTDQAWLSLRGTATLQLGQEPLLVEYRPAVRELPVSIKLLDFRKTDYPGTDMAASFESDVEMTDASRGLMMMKTIRMNNPLRYRGFSFYQAGYLPGPPETTILSVRNDPGTPLVYAGFLIVIGGVVNLFLFGPVSAKANARPSKKRRAPARKPRSLP